MELEQKKQEAKELFQRSKELKEYSILLIKGSFKGEYNKSWDKCYKFLEQQFKDTIKSIQENEWYSNEYNTMAGINVGEMLKDTDIQHDPNYTISMEDVFREVAKKERKKEVKE